MATLVLICFFMLSVNVFAASDPQTASSGSSANTPAELASFKDLILMSAYGTVAGMIVGAATLAFTAHPMSKLKRVAIGASLGLYVGIILGGLIMLDKSLGSQNSIFDTPGGQGEEVPIVHYRNNKLNLSFPTIMLTANEVDLSPANGKLNLKSQFVSANLLKVTF
jgi:hypothetical protein